MKFSLRTRRKGPGFLKIHLALDQIPNLQETRRLFIFNL